MISNQTAKISILSSFITILVIFSVGYIGRNEIIDYLQGQIVEQSKVKEIIPTIDHNEQIIKTIESVNPAVVSVVVTKEVPVYEQYYETYNPWGLPQGFSIPHVRKNGTEQQEIAGGSGFIVSNDGLIVTNRHVVKDENASYTVLLNDGTSYAVDVVARDPQLDVAILKITDPLEASLTYASFGNSDNLRLGETVIAIGNALAEFRNSVSVGVVSGLARSIVASDGKGQGEQLDKVIQTDAAINPGNSGGPLLNIKGEVIGVNVAVSLGAENIGFALPSNVIKEVVESVRKYGEIVRPFLGVRYVMVTKQIAKTNNLDIQYGALITSGNGSGEVAVLPDSPADQAGLIAGDIILKIDGEQLRDVDLATMLRSKKVGQAVELLIWQEGEEKTLTVTLDKAL